MQLASIGAITLFVDDVAHAKAWYQRVFERPIVYEDDDSVVLRFEATLVNLLRRAAAVELVAPASVGPRADRPTFQVTIWVDDVDAVVAVLVDRGVELINGPLDRPWGQRTACFTDPDGHLWEIAQTI